MLKGLFTAVLLCASYGLVYLAYGKKGIAYTAETSGSRKLIFTSVVVALGTLFWGMALLFWIEGIANKDLLMCKIATFALPVLYLLWVVFTRQRVKAEMEASEQEEAVIQQEQEKYAKREEEARIKWEQSKQAERENPPERIKVVVDRSEETLTCPNCKRAQRSDRKSCYNCGAIFEDETT